MASSSAAGSSIGSKPDWDALLSSALNVSAGADREVEDMKLPWELPAFEDIFQPREGMREDAMLVLQDPAWALSEQVSESLEDRAAKRQRVLTSIPDSALCFKVVRKSEGPTWQERRDNLLEKALSRWIYLISKWDEVCPELPICHAIMSCTSVEKQKQVLCDWLHSKAPGTLLKRVNALLMFHRAMGWQVDIPYKEEVMYNYMSDSRAGGAKPSQLQSLREALIFVRHVLSMEQLETFVKSRRCAGVVKGQRKQRRKAPPLKVPELRKLHRMLGDEHGQLWDRMFAGACLACAYMRARWGDFQQTVRFSIDRDGNGNSAYLEFQSDVFKTMNAKFWNDEPAIWVAPALGVSDQPWLDLWLSVRQELGIVGIEPPLPTPATDGTPGEAGVSTAEIGAWLRLALPRDAEPLSAHSLKRTLLSYANKRGLGNTDKLILGHHCHQGKMADVYGDDYAARPLRLLEGLLSDIRDGSFDPDASRAGRFVGPTESGHEPPFEPAGVAGDNGAGVESVDEDGSALCSFERVSDHDDDAPLDSLLEQPDTAEIRNEGPGPTNAADGESSSSSDSESTSSSGSDVLTDTDHKEASRVMGLPVPAEGTHFLVHSNTKMLHMIADGNSRVMLCGRAVQDVHRAATDIRFDSSVCSMCKRAARSL